MTQTTTSTEAPHSGEASEHSMLFAQLIMQQSNMAMMFMGKVSHGQGGQVPQDLEAARLFIDQLEMLQAKTKGNLTRDEENLLNQTLMSLRLSFVEAVDASGEARPQAAPESQESAAPSTKQSPGGIESAATPSDEEHRKKFTKKY